eukprot:TRINITY_DN4654_c0_g1_i2.p2 TRINITY_DN4654_c0_g1~~TRINITY_DN4654_c0_g1_i2.p2  ORF type:complete len:133 (-),score=26.63 TRINITY_DN4654_c0_g1_i2:29-427(-)
MAKTYGLLASNILVNNNDPKKAQGYTREMLKLSKDKSDYQYQTEWGLHLIAQCMLSSKEDLIYAEGIVRKIIANIEKDPHRYIIQNDTLDKYAAMLKQFGRDKDQRNVQQLIQTENVLDNTFFHLKFDNINI